ncbi:MAG: hypothetical protein L6R40_006467 [Gallowayella cf. fulva]|nr:MAG: hypothetical protein L6R40_006467 [Xanthomendoza cf. fulva]
MTESEKPVCMVLVDGVIVQGLTHVFQKPPGSPPTDRALDLDDGHHDQAASPGRNTLPQGDQPSKLPSPGSVEDVAPPKPPRPPHANPLQQAENTLKEAFPSIDLAVIKAVLRASSGNVEPAFNALLGFVFQAPLE